MAVFFDADEEDLIVKQIKKAGLYYTNPLLKDISPELLKKVNKEIAVGFRVIPVLQDDGVLQLVTDSDASFKNGDQLRTEIGLPIRIFLTDTENIKQGLIKYYNIEDYHHSEVQSTELRDESPLKQKVHDMLQMAASKNASDIHILPHSKGVHVWFRIFGHLVDLSDEYSFTASDGLFLINIIKGMDTSGNTDMTQTNMPNRGSFAIRRGETLIDCRISTVPVGSMDGRQKANIRLMPQKNELIQLEKLYSGKDLESIKITLQKSASGLFLISGPVGSGKSTSLYAQINYLWDQAKEPLNVYCIENPIEIKDERFVQVQVREAVDEALALTAPKILKTALRSDPDVILYGEIRDSEDARVAVTASQTGHPVFSTVHASDCIRTISRLMDLDISKISLMSEIKMIVSQRLVGKLCPNCSREHKLTSEEKMILSDKEIEILTAQNTKLMERGSKETQKNCTVCSEGIIGRKAVAEYIAFNDDLRDALLSLHTFKEIHHALRQYGYQTIWEKGLSLVQTGEVELKELIDVIGKE